ncbi:SH3 domain-binding glutamic acid-rich-like protein 3 [Bulinus truncatus]|nr:SH3 domain-binding glutamic acid-rich-like protein 3 [Bulinus truncatus]
MTIIVYITSVTFKKELHTQQGHIETVLKAKQLPYQLIDIAQDVSKKDEMRVKCGDETAVAPQIFNEDSYCGDYKTFQQAVEEDKVLSFLKQEKMSHPQSNKKYLDFAVNSDIQSVLFMLY